MIPPTGPLSSHPAQPQSQTHPSCGPPHSFLLCLKSFNGPTDQPSTARARHPCPPLQRGACKPCSHAQHNLHLTPVAATLRPATLRNVPFPATLIGAVFVMPARLFCFNPILELWSNKEPSLWLNSDVEKLRLASLLVPNLDALSKKPLLHPATRNISFSPGLRPRKWLSSYAGDRHYPRHPQSDRSVTISSGDHALLLSLAF